METEATQNPNPTPDTGSEKTPLELAAIAERDKAKAQARETREELERLRQFEAEHKRLAQQKAEDDLVARKEFDTLLAQRDAQLAEYAEREKQRAHTDKRREFVGAVRGRFDHVDAGSLEVLVAGLESTRGFSLPDTEDPKAVDAAIKRMGEIVPGAFEKRTEAATANPTTEKQQDSPDRPKSSERTKRIAARYKRPVNPLG